MSKCIKCHQLNTCTLVWYELQASAPEGKKLALKHEPGTQDEGYRVRQPGGQVASEQLKPLQTELRRDLAVPVAAAALKVVYTQLWQDLREASSEVLLFWDPRV